MGPGIEIAGFECIKEVDIMRLNKSTIGYGAGLIFIGLIVGVILTTNLNWTPRTFASRTPVEPVTLGNPADPPDSVLRMQDTGKAFVAVSREILPTVVSISTSRIIRRSPQDNPLGDIFRDWFGRENRQSEPEVQRQQGLGSGVIVNREGYILTNHHVIQNAEDIKVTLYDNRYFEAKLVGTDPLTEVAVIKIEGDDLPVARLGNSEELEIGEWVLAVGNPLQLSSTVTAGIVSAKSRNIGIIRDADAESEGSYAIENFIQTDAAINPGNSGGALVNLSAEVVGINTAIASRTGYYQGYGFAIPVDLAKKIMNDLIEKGYVTRAWLGIGMRAVTEAVAERYNMDRPRGVLVETVMDRSPASRAGVEVLDIILEIDGEGVNQPNEIQNAVALKSPGETVTLTLLRNRRERTVEVELGQRDTGREMVREEEEPGMPVLGLNVDDLNSTYRSQLNLDEDDVGALVISVEPYSAAFDANIRRGSLITRIEDDPIRSVSDYRRAIRKYQEGQVVIFHLRYQQNEYHAFVKMPE